MPIDERGYLRLTYDEILANRIALAKELFGDDIDTSDASALGKFIRLNVQDLADAYEAQELIYYARFPQTAKGANLDRLMPFAGISRNSATRAEHEIRFTGTPNHEIEPGFLVGTTGDETFYLLNPLALDESGTGIGVVQCTALGTVGNVTLGEITEIVNPDVDVLSIEHVDIKVLGEDVESDVALRKRFTNAIKGSGSATAAAIRGAVMRVNGVSGCIVVENEENEADSEGRPPHSFEVFVHAPESINQEIAEAIFEKKALGIKSVGDVEVTVKDVSGRPKAVCFSRVAEVTIRIRLTVATDAHFELTGVEQIKTALIEYIGSLTTGDDVVYTSLYKHIFGVAGVKDVVEMSISGGGGAYSTSNVSMAPDNIAVISASDINIEVTSYVDR